MRALLLLLLAAVSVASASHTPPPRTEESLGTAVVSWPATVAVDPGAPLADRNPRVLLPGTTEVRARAVVTDAMGNGVAGVHLIGGLETTSGAPRGLFEFESLSPGVYQSKATLPYEGGSIVLVVAYDFPHPYGAVDHVARHVYRPALG